MLKKDLILIGLNWAGKFQITPAVLPRLNVWQNEAAGVVQRLRLAYNVKALNQKKSHSW